MSSRGSWRRCSSGSVGRSCAISCKRGAPTPKAGPAIGLSRPRLILSRCWHYPDSSHQVQEAADASELSVAAWERYAMRQVTLEDFPLSWRAGETVPRSHDSPGYQRSFTLRLDDKPSRKRPTLTQTFTTFSADLTAHAPPRRITAYFKNSKVPVWAFREVERPCYQIPMEVIVKEIAAKLNAHVFGRVASTETVNKIAASITPGQADAASEEYLEVLELGHTNNPSAVEPLVRLTNREEVLMRASAISALGILGAKDQLPLLKKIYETSDKLVKSIGDLDTTEAHEFLRSVKQSKDYADDTIREVVDLYAADHDPRRLADNALKYARAHRD
jgi:HEAT repeats